MFLKVCQKRRLISAIQEQIVAFYNSQAFEMVDIFRLPCTKSNADATSPKETVTVIDFRHLLVGLLKDTFALNHHQAIHLLHQVVLDRVSFVQNLSLFLYFGRLPYCRSHCDLLCVRCFPSQVVVFEKLGVGALRLNRLRLSPVVLQGFCCASYVFLLATR